LQSPALAQALGEHWPLCLRHWVQGWLCPVVMNHRWFAMSIPALGKPFTEVYKNNPYINKDDTQESAMKTNIVTVRQAQYPGMGNKLLLCLGVSSVLAVTSLTAQSAMLEEIVVTAQKRAESVQDVPIAVSAFSQGALESQGLLGGADLKLSVPNVSFSETGFGRYNFQIRGIGGLIQGESADVGVGIHINNIPLTENRLVQAQFYDVERVEVLRGPQGTLYGRNATGGVVNVITAKPEQEFSAALTGEYASFNSRKVRGHVNMPLTDQLAVRLAGTVIKQDGNIDNLGTGNDVDSRDLWSSRLSVQWEPTETFRATAIWEHFKQDDTSGANQKVVCAADPGPATIGGVATDPLTRSLLSQGCLGTDVESPLNNGVANSLTGVPGIIGLLAGVTPFNYYTGKVVDTDLHTVEADFDPTHEAENDIFSLQMEFDLNDHLTFTSLTSYSEDEFISENIFTGGIPSLGFLDTPLSPGGLFLDPQLGLKDRSSGKGYFHKKSEQYTQEFRLQSAYDGDLNYSVGAIYMDFESDVDNLVLGTSVNQLALALNAGGAGIYIDPGFPPDGTGHNYFNSKSPYQLKASALFGELYYNINDDVKATVGLRYTKDEKEQITNPVLMLTPGRGFPAIDPQEVTFEEITGRFTVDWKPSDDTLVYASYARGYKGGGFNPGGAGGDTIRPSFDPEFVDAIEIGTKNVLAEGRLSLNASLFYYDYQDYQIAKVLNQTVANENVDAEVTGLELEVVFEPIDNLRFNAQIGWMETEISDGESIDTNDRTQGVDGLSIVRSMDPGSGLATSCTMPTAALAGLQGAINAGFAPSIAMGFQCSDPLAIDGVPVQLSGKELPSAPNWTASLGAEYTVDLTNDWQGTVRADYYAQDDNYARIYNSKADKINSYDNLNLSFRMDSEAKGLELLVYARNLLSEDSITNFTVQSDEVGGARSVTGKAQPSYGIALTKRW
jgi:outer membrane receptor protein involved in Fe transport